MDPVVMLERSKASSKQTYASLQTRMTLVFWYLPLYNQLMLLTFLSRIMASLLTTLLFVSIVGATANQTVLDTGYIETTLEDQKGYDRLSEAISKEISQNSNDPSIPQTEVASQLKTVITPEVLKAKIDTTLKQLQAYFREDGPVPTLDISDLVQEAQANGLSIDAEKFNEPVQLTAVTKVKKLSDVAQIISIGTLIVVALLLVGVLAIAIKRRDYRPLANVVFSLGLMLTVTGACLMLVPRVFSKMYTFNEATNPFGSLAHDLAVIAIHDFGIRLLIPGVIALLIGIIAKLMLRKRKQKRPLDYAKADPVPETNGLTAAPVSVEDAPTTPTQNGPSITPGAPPAPRQVTKPRKIQL